MSSISDVISKSLKEKYKSNIIEENMLINMENIEKTDIITEDHINNLSSALMVGIVTNDIIKSSREKRKLKH
jgi:hypothetical protein